MHPGLVVTLICGAVGISLVIWTRWKAIGHRTKIPLRRLYNDGHLEGIIDFDNFAQVMNLVGRAYGFDPERIRITDSFSGDLAAADATLPDDAPKTLWASLKENYPSLSESRRFETISELMAEVGKGRVDDL
jgi:hypothetical protein